MIEIVEKHDVNPICPHCSDEIQTLWIQTISSFLGKRYIYFCSKCRKVMGISHRKGFWMG